MLWNVVAGSDTITIAGTMPSAKAPKTMLIRYRRPAILARRRGDAPATGLISNEVLGADGVSVVFIIAPFGRGDGGKNREATLGVSAGEEEPDETGHDPSHQGDGGEHKCFGSQDQAALRGGGEGRADHAGAVLAGDDQGAQHANGQL